MGYTWSVLHMLRPAYRNSLINRRKQYVSVVVARNTACEAIT